MSTRNKVQQRYGDHPHVMREGKEDRRAGGASKDMTHALQMRKDGGPELEYAGS